jgi:hypothetical protein
MNVTGFTEAEKLALLDLLVLGMYADGHLAAAEDARIQRLLDTTAAQSDDAKQKAVDASATKARRLGSSPSSVREAVVEIAGSFPRPEARRRVCDALEDLLSSDGNVTDREREFLAEARDVFVT